MSALPPSGVPVSVACGYPLLISATFAEAQAVCARSGSVPVAVDPAGRCTYILDSLPAWLTLGGLYFELRAVPQTTVRAYEGAHG